MEPRLSEIIEFLSKHRIRASYGAVAEVLDVLPRSMGARLGPRTREASWVVNADTGLPTGYSAAEMDPALLPSTELIRSGSELASRMRRK
jgi:hypothetical protein